MSDAFWKLNELEYFEAPGVSLLVFHNQPYGRKQSGLEIIQQSPFPRPGQDFAPGQFFRACPESKRAGHAHRLQVHNSNLQFTHVLSSFGSSTVS